MCMHEGIFHTQSGSDLATQSLVPILKVVYISSYSQWSWDLEILSNPLATVKRYNNIVGLKDASYRDMQLVVLILLRIATQSPVSTPALPGLW